ncbi:hypothetical protein SAMN04488503_2816 [Humidesulfovibrio mexicanus]|uniref:Uncharacterized protein n=1 Tax=Humidesulfovibrio mexicanus TaxID=147047 RepID=A0A239BXC7_9BACT|nr:hypothetical protein [Humidesulfovibrio mexicanus]SNS11724.1 hypothetical protein SAMN04488503_2816 [Humidesulfovibrio mexicanus]
MIAHAVLFHGTDLAGPGQQRLLEDAAQGRTLVALDSQALAWTLREGLAATILDDWLDETAQASARALATRLETSWFEPARAGLTFDGLCWPEFDREALYAYWLSAATAHGLMTALVARGVRALTVFRRNPPRPMLYFEPADTAALYWAAAFPGQVESVVLPEPQEAATPSPAPDGDAQPDFFLHDNAELLRGRAAVCLNPLEVFRLGRHIRELRAAFGDRVVLVVNSHLPEHIRPIARDTGLPVLGLGPAGNPGPDVAGRCAQALELLQNAQPEPLRTMLAVNAAHFAALFRRWTWLEATRGYWRRAMAAAPPALVAVSSLEDSESQLPASVAGELGIPSLCLPHGVGLTRAARPKADLVLHLGQGDREAYLRSGITAKRLVPCADLGIENEYPVDTGLPWAAAKGKLNVLALMAATGRPGVLYPVLALGAQLAALRALAAPPADLAPRLALSLKTHPGLPDLEAVDAAGPEARALLAPLDLPLARALAAADLVVALNYTGVGVLHCAEAGKPLLHFRLDPHLGRAEPFPFADIYDPAGDMTLSADAFWAAVRRFLTEPEYAQGLASKARDFARGFHAGKRRSLRDIAADFAPQGGGSCAS